MPGTGASIKGAVLTGAGIHSARGRSCAQQYISFVFRPGTDVLFAAGGIHKFMQWHHPVLTDSGGYCGLFRVT